MKYLPFLFLFTLSIKVCGQSTFENALRLRAEFVDSEHAFNKADNSRKVVVSILAGNYFDQYDTTYIRLRKAVKGNPFLDSTFFPKGGAAGAVNAPKGIANVLNKVGGIDVTAISDGLAKFIVKRTKQELSIAFFQRFKEEMNSDKYKELNILFPATSRVLNLIDKDVYQYSNYLISLREAFDKDLSSLIIHLPLVWKLDKYKSFFDSRPELLELLAVTEQLYYVTNKGKHPGDALHDLSKSETPNPGPSGLENFKSALKTVDLISQSFRSTNSDNYWIEGSEIKKLTRDTTLFKIYMGLLYQENLNNYNIVYKTKNGSDSLKNIFKAKAPDILSNSEALLDFIQEIGPHLASIDRQLKDLKEKGKKAEQQELYDLFDSFLDLTRTSLKINEIPFIKILEVKIPKHLYTAISLGSMANEAFLDISKRNYNSAVIETIGIIDSLIHLFKTQIYLQSTLQHLRP